MAQKASLSFSTLPAPMGDPQSWVAWNDDGSDETGFGDFWGPGVWRFFLADLCCERIFW